MPVFPISIVAVIVASVVVFLFGYLWYGVVFSKLWMQLSGITPEKMAQTNTSDMVRSYVLSFVGTFLMAYVLSHAIVFASAYMNVSGVSAGVSSGFWNWLGFVAPVTLGNVLWRGESWKRWSLENGYYLLSLPIMGAILAGWSV